jgi:hypothetical protein
MGKQSDLFPECQKFVKKFFFFSKENATKKPIVSFDRVYQKTSKALCVSYTSVHRITCIRTELFDYHLFFYKYIQDQWELE